MTTLQPLWSWIWRLWLSLKMTWGFMTSWKICHRKIQAKRACIPPACPSGSNAGAHPHHFWTLDHSSRKPIISGLPSGFEKKSLDAERALFLSKAFPPAGKNQAAWLKRGQERRKSNLPFPWKPRIPRCVPWPLWWAQLSFRAPREGENFWY